MAEHFYEAGSGDACRVPLRSWFGAFLHVDAVRREMERAALPPSVYGFDIDLSLPRRTTTVCEHPAALLVLADALATCDGCGRVFELRAFGK